MSTRFTLSDLPPHYAAQAQAQLGKPAKPMDMKLGHASFVAYPNKPLLAFPGAHPVSSPTPTEKTPPRAKEPAKNRIRQNAAGLNKTEQAFKDYLQAKGGFPVLVQAITLRIGNGVRYTVDFVTIRPSNVIEGWEVKGFMRDDAAVKLKVAASLYPWIKFHLVTRKKGEWIIQEVLP